MWRFVRGIFTDHLMTKALALVLSFVLFQVVAVSLEETGEIDQLTLEFELSEDLLDAHVLLTPTVSLKNLSISGSQRKVDAAMQSFRAERLRILIDSDFLDRHGPSVDIDEEFLEAEVLLEGVTVKGMARAPRLRLDGWKEETMTLELTAEAKRKTVLAKDSKFQGTGAGGELQTSFNFPTLVLRGPAGIMSQAKATLLVTIGDLELVSAGKGIEVPATIEWDRSGIFNQAHVTVEDPPMSMGALRARLKLHFDLKDRPVSTKLKLDIVQRGRFRGLKLVDDYNYFGPEGVENFKLDNTWRTCEVGLEMPQRVSEIEGIEKRLMLVLDLSSAIQGKEGGRLTVPIHLGVKDRAQRHLLDEIRIVGTNPRLGFSKK